MLESSGWLQNVAETWCYNLTEPDFIRMTFLRTEAQHADEGDGDSCFHILLFSILLFFGIYNIFAFDQSLENPVFEPRCHQTWNNLGQVTIGPPA